MGYSHPMNCPSCGVNAESAVECPSCGVIFAKWKVRPAAPPPAAAAERGLGVGTVVLVLALTLGGVWLYARKTIVLPTPEPVSTDAAPVPLYLGASAKAAGELQISIAPLAKYDGYTKKQIYDIRRSAIAEHPELAGKGY